MTDLKETYGAGYLLNLTRNVDLDHDDPETDPLATQISRLIPQSEVLARNSNVERYHIPKDVPSKDFMELMAIMEHGGGTLGLEDFSVGVTSLEDIFMALVRAADNKIDLSNGGKNGVELYERSVVFSFVET